MLIYFLCKEEKNEKQVYIYGLVAHRGNSCGCSKGINQFWQFFKTCLARRRAPKKLDENLRRDACSFRVFEIDFRKRLGRYE
jgi:hypothetical protein